MVKQKSTRASDINRFGNIDQSGFIARKRTKKQQIYIFCLFFAVVVAGVTFIVGNDALYGSTICTLIGIGMLILGHHYERLQKTLLATEFMNALFSSALGKKCRFCSVVRQDGEIVYLNQPFQKMFPEFLAQSQCNLNTLLTMQGIAPDQREKIMSLVTLNSEGTIPITLGAEPVTLSMEPIDRPSGFMLVRGH